MNAWFDEQGRLTVKVPLSWQLPEVTVRRTIGNTEYCVSGTYDGLHTLPSKTLHLMELLEDKQ